MLIAQTTTAPTVIAAPSALVEQITCPVVTQMIKYGAENPLADVSNLQRVLRDIEHMDVFVTGDYDEQTLYAVIAFQQKYADEILAPYGKGAQPTGIVSLTTTKKLNQLACGTPLTLDDHEMRFIAVVADKALRGDANAASVPQTITYTLTPQQAAPAPAVTPSEDDTDADDAPAAGYPYYGVDMSASAANTPTAQKFGAYIRNLFR